ncbi:MAG: regulatory protein RecX [Ignavibacteriae bacterium]|nr:regulatory protein RecX [Ignavibacteriota bacterium]
MIVVDLKKKGSIVNISFDNSELVSVPYEIFLKNNMYIGDEISSEQVVTLKEQSQLYLIKQSAYRYLGNRNHSRSELKNKLLKKGFEKGQISTALKDLIRLGYLDDAQFAKSFFSLKVKQKKGPNRIKAELFKKGVDRKIIELVSRDFIDDDQILNSVNELVIKKYNFLKTKEYTKIQIKQKLYQFLLSRGFTSELIMQSIETILKENYE